MSACLELQPAWKVYKSDWNEKTKQNLMCLHCLFYIFIIFLIVKMVWVVWIWIVRTLFYKPTNQSKKGHPLFTGTNSVCFGEMTLSNTLFVSENTVNMDTLNKMLPHGILNKAPRLTASASSKRIFLFIVKHFFLEQTIIYFLTTILHVPQGPLCIIPEVSLSVC